MNRRPPAAVRRGLAAEVGFGCPVEDCGSPYLTWHHFDPPWAEHQHHDPQGMIALCRDHHPEADAGAFTPAQLREMKLNGRDRGQQLGGRFNWMRDRLLAVVGGNFYYDVRVAVSLSGTPVVWFNRDDQGRLLVNLTGLTTSGRPRIQMEDNFWMTEGDDEAEIECPPSGKKVSAKYPNGDRLSIEFREIATSEALGKRYPLPDMSHLPEHLRDIVPDPRDELAFPLAAVEIAMNIANTPINLGAKATTIDGGTVGGNWTRNATVGLCL